MADAVTPRLGCRAHAVTAATVEEAWELEEALPSSAPTFCACCGSPTPARLVRNPFGDRDAFGVVLMGSNVRCRECA